MQRRFLVITLFVCAALGSCNPPPADTALAAVDTAPAPLATSGPATISAGHIDQIDSVILGEQRDIWIHLPRSAQGDEIGDRKYPVVYLLDGSGHFFSVTGMIRQLSTTNGNSALPEMIVVAIPNTDRTRDLTPTHVDRTSGGGRAFVQFIAEELMPYVEATYPVADHKTFIGHSLGGLTVIDTLLDNPALFDHYIAIDPSLWWDDQLVLKQAQAKLTELNLTGKSLFVGVANTMRGRISIDQVEADTDPSTVHIRSILEFSRFAEGIGSNGLDFDWKYYDNDSHGSVPLIVEYDALRRLFAWHDRTPLMNSLFLDPAQPIDQLLAMVTDYYGRVSSEFGFEMLPPENFVNAIANNYLSEERAEPAEAFLQFNVNNYPESAAAVEALGDFYVTQDDRYRANAAFTRAFSLGSPSAREKLSQLNAGN